jgi:hypothetical protein
MQYALVPGKAVARCSAIPIRSTDPCGYPEP